MALYTAAPAVATSATGCELGLGPVVTVESLIRRVKHPRRTLRRFIASGGEGQVIAVVRRGSNESHWRAWAEKIFRADDEMPARHVATNNVAHLRALGEMASEGLLDELAVVRVRGQKGAAVQLELVEGVSIERLRYEDSIKSLGTRIRYDQMIGRIASRIQLVDPDIELYGEAPTHPNHAGRSICFRLSPALAVKYLGRERSDSISIEELNVLYDQQRDRFVLIDPF